jgi:hypothetical protein
MRMLKHFMTCACVSLPLTSLSGAQPDAGSASERDVVVVNCGTIPDLEPGNNAIASATPLDIACRSTAVGMLEMTPDDTDCYVVPGQVGDYFCVFTVPLSTLPSAFAQPDTIVEIFGANDELLVGGDDAGSTFPDPGFRLCSAVRFAPQTTGNFKIRVRGYSSATAGRYGLLIANVSHGQYAEASGNTFAEYADVPNGIAGPLVGYALTGSGDTDYYGVDLNPGDVLLAATVSTSITFNLNNTSMDIRVFAPDQATQIVASFTDFGANYPPGGPGFNTTSANAFILARASVAGKHFIEVTKDSTGASADYHLVSWVIPAEFCPGDADRSGVVQFLDITTVLANFGNSCP